MFRCAGLLFRKEKANACRPVSFSLIYSCNDSCIHLYIYSFIFSSIIHTYSCRFVKSSIFYESETETKLLMYVKCFHEVICLTSCLITEHL